VLLLIVPARSRVFDAWNFPVPYAALLVISVLLACSRRWACAAPRGT